MNDLSNAVVALAFPSGDMVHADFAASLAALCLNPGARTAIVNCKGSLISVGRNQCVAAAQVIKATHILFLDTDMIFPIDTLKKLLGHDKDIVGALYSKRVEPFHALGVPHEDQSNAPVGLRRMKTLPTGCLLIKTGVFDRLPKPYFSEKIEGERVMGEDYYFCARATAAGFEIWQDIALSTQIGHIGQKIYKIDADGKPA